MVEDLDQIYPFSMKHYIQAKSNEDMDINQNLLITWTLFVIWLVSDCFLHTSYHNFHPIGWFYNGSKFLYRREVEIYLLSFGTEIKLLEPSLDTFKPRLIK